MKKTKDEINGEAVYDIVYVMLQEISNKYGIEIKSLETKWLNVTDSSANKSEFLIKKMILITDKGNIF